MSNREQTNWLGQRISEYRNSAGLTQPQLAKKCGWLLKDGSPAQTRVSNYEKGRRTPTPDELIILENALELHRGALFGVEQYPWPHPGHPEGNDFRVAEAGENERIAHGYTAPPPKRVMLRIPEWLFEALKREAENTELSIAAVVLLRLQRSFTHQEEVEKFVSLIERIRDCKDIQGEAEAGDSSIFELINLAVDISHNAAQKQGLRVKSRTTIEPDPDIKPPTR